MFRAQFTDGPCNLWSGHTERSDQQQHATLILGYLEVTAHSGTNKRAHTHIYIYIFGNREANSVDTNVVRGTDTDPEWGDWLVV